MLDWTKYQKETYNNETQTLLIEFLKKHKVETAIDLGCGSGNETIYMIKNGIKVLAIDKQLNKNNILERLTKQEKQKISFIEKSFEQVELPKTDLITAFFSIPFCNPKEFNNLWKKIYDAINKNGYFVGQLFGNRDDWNKKKNINTFSKEQVEKYLEPYKIIKLEEVEYTRKIDNKKWHFFDIIAKKEE